MRYSPAIVGALAFCASEVVAFPAAAIEYAARAENDISARENIEAAVAKFQSQRRAPGFDAAQQYVSTHGQYEFKPPTNPNTYTGDQRGPCPGLNAMANHNYIPHNGVANIQQFIDGTYKVFGMGKDLGGFLALYGALVDGNLASWSIGGPTPSVKSLLGLLGTPGGLTGSHNKYEGDASPTRPDLYEYGNDYKVIIPQFQEMFSLQPDAATANYDLSVLTPFRATRFQQSIEKNPQFFNAPFAGLLVQPAAYTFIYRFMSNKSAEFPEGRLNQEVLKSFFAITGESGNFKWTEGHERIPENWYKRAIGDEYTIPYFLGDLLAAAVQYPQFLNIGGNTGKVNTFTGIDITNLTGGLLNGATLLEGNNLACFLLQGVFQFLPDTLLSTVGELGALLSKLNGITNNALAPLSCKKLVKINKDQFSQFPGAKGLF
ncbi:related to oxidase [Rhynchosporium secalis]|uniref:Related to oxidase n=1 Tax=Rhynchosporium secalis TaxID=38038 RepID=A0A1E1LYM0_RHYSE|nr:related to oxidase [Rhynchosporium secalis]